MCFVYLKDVNEFHFSPKKDRPMVFTAESEVTINLTLHDLALGRVSFDFWLFLLSAWPNTLRAFFGKITLSRPWVDISLLHCLSDKKRPRAEISGTFVRHGALAPRLRILRSISLFYGNSVFRLYCLRNLKCSIIDGPTRLVLKIPECRLAISINFSDDEYSNALRLTLSNN